MENLHLYIDFTAKIIESAGVIIIAGGSMFNLLKFVVFILSSRETSYTKLRHDLGKVILLGLEILVAADIIATVTTEPTMNSVLVLAVIVLIRIFLSFSLHAELEGKFPWQSKKDSGVENE